SRIAYEQHPGVISVEITGLLAVLEQEYSVWRRTEEPPYFEPRVVGATEVAPGAYFLELEDQVTSVEAEHPDAGTENVIHVFRASSIAFALDSGEHLHLTPEYELRPGTLRISIEGLEETDLTGEVAFRRVGDTDWTIASDDGMNIFEVIPGIYEVQARDVPDPSEGGTYHYRPYGINVSCVFDS